MDIDTDVFTKLDKFIIEIQDLKYGFSVLQNIEKLIYLFNAKYKCCNCFKLKRKKLKKFRDKLIKNLDIAKTETKYFVFDIIDEFIKIIYRDNNDNKIKLIINFAKLSKIHEFVLSEFMKLVFK